MYLKISKHLSRNDCILKLEKQQTVNPWLNIPLLSRTAAKNITSILTFTLRKLNYHLVSEVTRHQEIFASTICMIPKLFQKTLLPRKFEIFFFFFFNEDENLTLKVEDAKCMESAFHF